jgi:hypothetical protein
MDAFCPSRYWSGIIPIPARFDLESTKKLKGKNLHILVMVESVADPVLF